VGICNPGREAFAQLLRATALVGGTAPTDSATDIRPTSLPGRLVSASAVRIAAPESLSRASASEAVELLKEIVHHNAELQTTAPPTLPDAAVITIIPFEHFAARARALLHGRLAPSVDDVLALTESVLQHRMQLTFAARAERVTMHEIILKLKANIG